MRYTVAEDNRKLNFLDVMNYLSLTYHVLYQLPARGLDSGTCNPWHFIKLTSANLLNNR